MFTLTVLLTRSPTLVYWLAILVAKSAPFKCAFHALAKWRSESFFGLLSLVSKVLERTSPHSVDKKINFKADAQRPSDTGSFAVC